jgi:hypothetical protein
MASISEKSTEYRAHSADQADRSHLVILSPQRVPVRPNRVKRPLSRALLVEMPVQVSTGPVVRAWGAKAAPFTVTRP